MEYPWLLGSGVHGSLLDAGATLNHPYVLNAVLPAVSRLDVVTLAPESHFFPERSVSYVWADLRELPFRTALYDTISCLSTLEHVGMDNTGYGGSGARAEHPEAEARQAVRELRRVLKPGGSLYITVPYGARGPVGSFRQFGREDVEGAIEAFGPAASTSIRVYRYWPEGWATSDLEAAFNVRYRDRFAEPVARDAAVAARAVACVRLVA